ncbi:B3 domain-containing protein Os06g0194400 isoform X1 [Rosa chinensis]|uniref:B3 domain-containing protein Os06g0194400 isoform X1 n=1 Tax=Rosa chinensis TaxID=74649 RepID=UPI000D087498|nr:B3 domain-containing protein Os06g0194400 isoform X1 [Rosa chinensis]
MLQHKMNDREEEMSEDFREEKQEEEKDRMDISPLSVTRQQFDNLTLHSTFSVQQRKRSKIRTSRFSPTQIVKFQNLTLDSPNSEQRQPLAEANKYGFKTPKGKRHLSPDLNTKREVSSDPQRHGGCKRSRTNPSMSWHFGHPEESPVKSQVREIPENLEAECPFFMKSMIRSNISVCFMLTLPRRFCNLHLPLHGTATITLEDKEGKEYETKFLADKRTLSGGWKGFCQAKDLRLDDVLVFQLVSPLKFKVYRLRPEYDPSEDDVDAAFVLLKMSTSEQTLSEENPPMQRKTLQT